MTVVVWVFALLPPRYTSWSSLGVLLCHAPGIHQGVFGVPATDVPAVRLWAFNVGFYNLFIGLGMVAGVVAWMAGDVTAGRTLVLYLLVFMFLSGVVLLVADRLGLGREKGSGIGGAIGQSGPPLIALVAAAVAMG